VGGKRQLLWSGKTNLYAHCEHIIQRGKGGKRGHEPKPGVPGEKKKETGRGTWIIEVRKKTSPKDLNSSHARGMATEGKKLLFRAKNLQTKDFGL